MTWQKELSRIVKGNIRFNEPISRHTTWGAGGSVEVLVEPKDLSDLIRAIKFSHKNNLPLFVIGAGSNLLVSDRGVAGIVLKLSGLDFKNIKFNNNYVSVGSGLSLNRLVNLTQAKGLSGCEFLAGIPGTLGGALAMNAGIRNAFLPSCQYLSISNLVSSIKVLDSKGRLKALKREGVKFGYRSSNLSKFIIISARLKLRKGNKKDIAALIKKFVSYKRNIQDLKTRSAGCVFKNPTNTSKNGNLTAGKLIDACGLKGLRLGKAEVSRIHANFILNRGGARAEDIFKLICIVQKRVKQKFGVVLEPEVKIIGKF